jgi:Domain of Unknown Function with PDB structure (DUF3861)
MNVVLEKRQEPSMYRYRITLESLSPETVAKELRFEVENHDDIFAIARRMSGKLGLDENATNAFALGLKLFGETILKNRDNPLFAQIKLSMGEFMRALKGNVRSSGSEPLA